MRSALPCFGWRTRADPVPSGPHVSANLLLARSGGRARQLCGTPQLARVPLGGGSCLRRTGHPFSVSGPCGPSQKIELVFSASPETIQRDPRELISFAQSAIGRTWQSARCVILLFIPQVR